MLLAILFLDAGLETPSHIPIKGLSPLLKLHYVDFNRLWVVPFCHAFYLGVFKDFLDAIFAKRASDGAQVCSLLYGGMLFILSCPSAGSDVAKEV